MQIELPSWKPESLVSRKFSLLAAKIKSNLYPSDQINFAGLLIKTVHIGILDFSKQR